MHEPDLHAYNAITGPEDSFTGVAEYSISDCSASCYTISALSMLLPRIPFTTTWAVRWIHWKYAKACWHALRMTKHRIALRHASLKSMREATDTTRVAPRKYHEARISARRQGPCISLRVCCAIADGAYAAERALWTGTLTKAASALSR